MEQINKKTRHITLMGMLLAMVTVLSFIEHQLPPLPPPLPPSVRFGLSNVIVMYTLFFLGTKSGYTMVFLKSLFVLLQRGVEASIMSIFGGLASISIIMILSFVFRHRISYLILSIAGAIAHNIGQMFAASLQFKVNMVKMYLIPMMIMGAVFGSVTGVLLKVVMPIFDKIMGNAMKPEETREIEELSSR